MDILIKALLTRTSPYNPPIVFDSRIMLNYRNFDYPEERTILPEKNGSSLQSNLYMKILEVLGDELSNVLFTTLKDYFYKYRRSMGFTLYQALSILEYLNKLYGNIYTLIAPTGMGKTEIFLTIILIHTLLNIKNGKPNRILIVYPRKMLEINQAERLITLLYYLNINLSKLGKKEVKLYIRDGDTHNIKEKTEKNKETPIPFRGIRFQGNDLLVNDKARVYYVDENGQERILSFLVPYQTPGAGNSDLVVTNLHTLTYRILSSYGEEDHDIDTKYVVNTSLLVLDEAHEYNSLLLANLHYMIASIASLRSDEYPQIIISTATLPNPEKFAQKLVPDILKPTVVDLSYEKFSKYLKDRTGKKAVLSLFVKIRPNVSWVTYISELSSLLLYYYWASIGDSKLITPQSIFFINNIKEINRTSAVLEETLELGSPADNLCIKKWWKSDKLPDSKKDPGLSCYLECNYPKSYNKTRRKYAEARNLSGLLEDLYEVVFSLVPLEKRVDVYKDFSEKKKGLLLATSSLELGVDYPQVSIIANAGFDRLPSLIQRFGRGGRSLESLYTSLNITIVRNNPVEYTLYADTERLKMIGTGILTSETARTLSKTGISYPSLDTPAIITYSLLRHACLIAIKNNERCGPIVYFDKISGNNVNNILETIGKYLDSEDMNKFLKLTKIQKEQLGDLRKELKNLADFIVKVRKVSDILEQILYKVQESMIILKDHYKKIVEKIETILKLAKSSIERNGGNQCRGIYNDLSSSTREIEQLYNELEFLYEQILEYDVNDLFENSTNKIKKMLNNFTDRIKQYIFVYGEIVNDRGPIFKILISPCLPEEDKRKIFNLIRLDGSDEGELKKLVQDLEGSTRELERRIKR